MLSLADMWRAAKSDPSKQPAIWRRSVAAAEFVDYVSVTLSIYQGDIFRTDVGGTNPGTWAHWHIAMAYAKYLSPEFHVWCNDVVRARGRTGRPAIK